MVETIDIGIPGISKLFTDSFPVGNNILLLTPPIAEIRLLGIQYLFEGLKKGEPGVFITMDDSPENLRVRALKFNWPLINAEKKGLMRWVDVYSIHADENIQSTESVIRIGGPLALTDLSIAVSQIQSDFLSMAVNYRFFFDSLSTLLLYNNPNTIYRFLQVITSKFKNSGGTGFFTLGRGMHDEKITMTIRHMMDGALELDDDMNLKVLSLPVLGESRGASLKLSPKGFSVE